MARQEIKERERQRYKGGKDNQSVHKMCNVIKYFRAESSKEHYQIRVGKS